MNPYENVFEAAMSLSSSDRVRLMRALQQALPSERRAELSSEWQAEIQTRLESVRSGEVQPIPAHEVMAAARARL